MRFTTQYNSYHRAFVISLLTRLDLSLRCKCHHCYLSVSASWLGVCLAHAQLPLVSAAHHLIVYCLVCLVSCVLCLVCVFVLCLCACVWSSCVSWLGVCLAHAHYTLCQLRTIDCILLLLLAPQHLTIMQSNCILEVGRWLLVTLWWTWGRWWWWWWCSTFLSAVQQLHSFFPPRTLDNHAVTLWLGVFATGDVSGDGDGASFGCIAAVRTLNVSSLA